MNKAEFDSLELPFFVYGTLRPQHGNYRLFAGRTISEQDASLPGFRMHSSGCPFIMEDEAETVVGTLLTVDPTLYASTLPSIDALEGFHEFGSDRNWYERKVVTVTVDGMETRAWTYIVEGRTAEHVRNAYEFVPSGDFNVYSREQAARRYAAQARAVEKAAESANSPGFTTL